MSINIQSQFNKVMQLAQSEGLDLTSAPIKESRTQFRASCSKLGIENEKDLIRILSEVRRRAKKVKYSSDERKRNNNFMIDIEIEVSKKIEELEQLRQEKLVLEQEIEFYKDKLNMPETPKEDAFYFDYYEQFLSPEILELMLEPSY